MKLVRVISMATILVAPFAFPQVEVRETPAPLMAVVEPVVAQQDTSRPPAENILVDQDVAVTEQKAPVYPEVAKKAGMEGKVIVKIWVTNEGRPRDVQILKSDAEVFNKSVIEAAWGFRFKPAYIKEKPVAAWVSVPFVFKLADKTSTSKAGGYNELSQFVKDVLNCKAVDSARIRTMVFPESYATIGGEYIHLMEALRSQIGGRYILEQPNRTIASTAYTLAGKGDAAVMTVRTEGKGKNLKPRYHTIVFFAGEKGDWTIRGWHSSQ